MCLCWVLALCVAVAGGGGGGGGGGTGKCSIAFCTASVYMESSYPTNIVY